ncbi:mus7 mms22 family protein [Colletotrichum karsti]|uniref:Mus7 mms22 family protein n=1 Tax=Colletotrichum karsti TaxID=1095194 RepID=A0A9P6IB39_9PEZI|nr:mus7 mms22 family protein [Colletotrichum karsti]KAF9878531.1 mus7 mms22 family protein [Colletotrichum karsti]
MANWKELGEVPDSDDELDFDSQELDGPLNDEFPTTSLDEALQTTQAPEDSVWDVPASSQAVPDAFPSSEIPILSHVETRPPASEPASSPLSSAQDVDDLADIFDLDDLPTAAPPTSRQTYTIDGRDDSPDPLMEDDSISTSYVKITAAPPEFPAENNTQSLPPPSIPMASPPRAPSSSIRGRQPSARSQQSPASSQHSPVRAPRSLHSMASPPRDSSSSTRDLQPAAISQQSPTSSHSTVRAHVVSPRSQRSPTRGQHSPARVQPFPPRTQQSPPTSQPRPPASQRGRNTDRDEEIARETAAVYARSFRKRKPIQEHPYLIENAQYSSVFKSHGLRPVRMPVEQDSSRRRKAAEEDSQEQDFEASQESTVDGPNEMTDESQAQGVTEPLHDDILRMSLSPLSSPLRTSSPKHRGGPSSQPSQGETDNTSLSDNEDLPSIDEIFRKSTTTQKKKRGRPAGARNRTKSAKTAGPSTRLSSGPTFQTYDEVYGVLSSSPLPPPTPVVPAAADELMTESAPPPGTNLAQVLFDDDDDPFKSPPRQAPTVANQESIDITMADVSDDEDNIQPEFGDVIAISEDEAANDAASGSESGTEAIRNVGRRIRGVLPASWLRLDQQATRPKPTQQHHYDQSPEKTQRRGVAVRRMGRSTSGTAASFLFDYSDDEATSLPKPTRIASGTGSVVPSQRATAPVIEIDDENSSAMEDNEIDHMAPSRKRQMTLNESFRPAKKQKTKTSTTGTQPKKRGRPPKATSRSTKDSRLDPWVDRQKPVPGASGHSARAKTPPRLSILDVIEPDAPRFLKVAARTAHTRRNLGRTSPTNKSIRLATRKDNVDAGTILQRWKGSKIQPRKGLQRKSSRPKQAGRRPLAPIPSNVLSRTPLASPKSRATDQPLRSVHESTETAIPSPRARQASRPFSRSHSTTTQRGQPVESRPAQLETDLADQPGRIGFHARKRALDAIFQRSCTQSLSARSIHLDSVIDDACSVASEQSLAPRVIPELPEAETRRPKRSRKSVQPIRVDLAAAHFRHADDPLPTTEVFTPVETPKTTFTDSQLLGLGPFGTHYTQHFEVFPLDRGVFFHETTLIGSGRVEAAIDELFPEKLWQPRSRVSFHLDERILRWDIWNEQVSSEFGILMDGILDQIFKPASVADSEFSTTDAARFVLDYVQKSMSFTDDAGAHSFVTRLTDVTRAFISRLDSGIYVGAEKRLQLIDVLSNLLLVVSSSVRLCQKHAPLISEGFTLENVLKKVAETLVRILLSAGLDEIHHLYEDLQSLSFRERGIRPDKRTPHAWVLLIRVLESLRIPRMNFWDVTHSQLIQPNVTQGSDAQEFERAWKDMFTLLPLCEFDNLGVLVPGKRHQTPVEGWNLPQQVMKRVFQLYRANPRQPPSFNDYCRSLVSRCHYLVDQWGWQKCSGVVGTIFDFFGSQNLSHLRNEEAFRSARFLDSLHQNPSLKVEAEDRCFHIFLKLVALVIKNLRKKGLVKDIRNLVARTLPNHDRQYSKEQDVHAHDLAALRNHHDLLCTLFWASPPDLRPGIHNLEKLVIPASSHKEACLINLRAWNQLARFVVHEESPEAFHPLAKWQANVFKQLLDSYNSAASDMQQQFLAMPKETTSRISEGLMNSIIAKNKAATMEIMLFSVKSSMDVVQHAASLELARLASSPVQLQHVFQHFSALPAEFPSGLLQASLTTLERLLVRIEAAFNEGSDSQDSMACSESEEAIMMLERELAAVFFSMARCILSSQNARNKPSVKAVSSACVEQAVVVSGIMTSLFVRCVMIQPSHSFKRGKFGVFENLPNKLSLEQRLYLPLFLSTVAQRGAEIQLADIGIDTLQLWLIIIVQPNHCLRFENRFGQQLQREGCPFVPDKAVGFVVNPGYLSNRDFFEYAMKWMRQSLQTTNAGDKKKFLADYSKALDNVMQQMRSDLEITSTESTTEHPNYVRFVRNIISLITTYGADICKVPSFFREVSKTYSPPTEDPELQVARILSYGLKLAEGNSGVASSLFYLLLNNFKKALQLGRLPQEVSLLKTAMKSDAVVAFTLRMLSAVLHATKTSPEAYALLDVFCDALGLVWSGAVITRQTTGNTLTSLSVLITSILDWATSVGGTPLCAEHVHVFRKVIWLINTLQPTVESFSLVTEGMGWWDDVMDRLDRFSLLVEGAQDYLSDAMDDSPTTTISPSALFRRIRGFGSIKIQDAMVLEWSRVIVDDVQRNWVVKGPVWTVPGSTCDHSSTQPTHGTIKLNWDMQELVDSLHDQLQIWTDWWRRGKKENERQGFDFEGYMIF